MSDRASTITEAFGAMDDLPEVKIEWRAAVEVPPMQPGDYELIEDDGLVSVFITLAESGRAIRTTMISDTGEVISSEDIEVPLDFGAIHFSTN